MHQPASFALGEECMPPSEVFPDSKQMELGGYQGVAEEGHFV